MLLIFTVAILAGSAQWPPPKPAPPPRPLHEPEQCLALQVRSPQGDADQSADEPVFSAKVHRDIDFSLRVYAPQSEPHRLQLKLYTPRGFLYQTLLVPFVGAPAALAAENDDEADEVEPQLSKATKLPRPRPTRVEARLPVGGSWIKAHTLYGLWRVVPHLDGNPRPCGPERTFEIHE